MPSIYTLSGFTFNSGSTGLPSSDFDAELTIEAPTNGASFSYSSLGSGTNTTYFLAGDIRDVSIVGGWVSSPVNVTLDSQGAGLWHMDWGRSNETTLLVVVIPFPSSNQLYFFPLLGDPLTSINSSREMEDFLRDFLRGEAVTDEHLPEYETILFSAIPNFATEQLPVPEGDIISGTANVDVLYGTEGSDSITALEGNDLILAQDGRDTVVAGQGDDTVTGGRTADDLRDVIFGGDGDDSLDGGYGNDELRGDGGNDTIIGGFGVDEIFGGAGNDVLTGQALSDLLFGGDGMDFINGGFGFDRVNGGAGADQFFHIGNEGHGSDWIQDYTATDGDVLVYGATTASHDQFQVNFTETASAGQAGVEEAFVIYRPTGQILWALVDGQAQSEINLQIGGDVVDLLG